jgi:uncharacterized protein
LKSDLLNTIYTVKGRHAGPKILVLGGVHGNEYCGVEAIEKLKNIEISNGILRFIVANPEAVRRGVRFVDENLNRVICENDEPKTYEARLALELLFHLRWSDYCLDVHASNTPSTTPFIIGNNLGLAEAISIETVVTNMADYYPDSTIGYAMRHGSYALAIEGGYVKDPDSTHVAIESIEKFLVKCGVIMGSIKPITQKYLEIFYQHNNVESFVPLAGFADFQYLQKGELIGYEGNGQVVAPEEGRIMFPRKRPQGFGECFFLAKEIER